MMIDAAYARTMARYNQWQNRSIYGAASTLETTPAGPRERPSSARSRARSTTSCGRICTLCRDATPPHLRPIKQSPDLFESWDDLCAARAAFDETIIAWADGLDAESLAGSLSWHSAAAGRRVTKPRALLVVHIFNHQTHHRGQVHCMPTQCAATPEDTDLPFMPRLDP